MNEQRCDDLNIPAFLLKHPPEPVSCSCDEKDDDFLKDVKGWSVNYPLEDCVE